MNGTLYYYRLRVVDSADNQSPFSESVSVRPRGSQFTLDKTITFGPIDETSSYRMVGLPGASERLLSSTFSGIADSNWTAYAANGITRSNQLDSYTPSFTFSAGHGFWVLGSVDWRANGTADAVTLDEAFRYTLFDLPSGWSIISNPFIVPLPWSDVQAVNSSPSSTATLWSYEGTWRQATTMEPYKGYYVFLESQTDLQFPFPYTQEGKQSSKSDLSNETLGSYRVRAMLVESGARILDSDTVGIRCKIDS